MLALGRPSGLLGATERAGVGNLYGVQGLTLILAPARGELIGLTLLAVPGVCLGLTLGFCPFVNGGLVKAVVRVRMFVRCF